MDISTKFDPKEHLTKSKGNKDYLEVKWRLVWLCEQQPKYTIHSEVVPTPAGAKGITVMARVAFLDENGDVIRSATGHKTSSGFAGGDLEKAETGAIGRALALLGYGTQFALELETDDPDENPVDSPVPPADEVRANLTPASKLPSPTSSRKPQNQPDPALEKLPPYQHADVPESDRTTTEQMGYLLEIGERLFPLKNDALKKRLTDAASKILNMRVTSLEKLHTEDAQEVLNSITATAQKHGVAA